MKLYVKNATSTDVIEWPDNLRLPVAGEFVSVEMVQFTVRSVQFYVRYTDEGYQTGEVGVYLLV